MARGMTEVSLLTSALRKISYQGKNHKQVSVQACIVPVDSRNRQSHSSITNVYRAVQLKDLFLHWSRVKPNEGHRFNVGL